MPQSVPFAMDSDLDIINDIITEELALSGHRATSPAPPRPSPRAVPPPPQMTEQLTNLNTGPQFIFFEEAEAFTAPSTSAGGACAGAGAGRFSRSISEPYRMRIDESRSGTAIGGAGSFSRQLGHEPYVVIQEQPRDKRFRYDKMSELKSAGVLYGVNTNKAEKKITHPAIKIGNHDGAVKITASLVCVEPPYRVHPNGLFRKNKISANNDYICVKYVEVTRQNCIAKFKDLCIRLVRSEQVEEALNLRERQKVDPFNQGYGKRDFSSSELQKVRLCFQVELMSQRRVLLPVVSDVINHSQRVGSLQIEKLCTCSGRNHGGPQIILICKKLNKKDLEVVFYEEEYGGVVWEQTVSSSKLEVYGDTTVVCSAPAYTRATIDYGEEVHVNIMLRRPSDGTCGDPKPFTYHADNALQLRKKRKQNAALLQQYVKDNWAPPEPLSEVDYSSLYDKDWLKKPYPGPFDVNLATPSTSTSGGFSFTPNFIENSSLQADIPMSPEMESIPSVSQPMSVAEDNLIIL